jgi:predicted kinase
MLIVITGPSHVGKSTVAAELVLRRPELAVVKYDQFLFDILGATRGGRDPDAPDFDLSYELMLDVVRRLVAHGRPTIVESTFTRVAKAGNGVGSVTYAHQSELRRILAFQPEKAFAVQLFAPWNTIRTRLMATGRLDEWVVEGTWEAHLRPWRGCLRLDAEQPPPLIAKQIDLAISTRQ